METLWERLSERLESDNTGGDRELLIDISSRVKESEIEGKQLLMAILSLGTAGFSRVLDLMVVHHFDGLWFTYLSRHFPFELLRLYEMHLFLDNSQGLRHFLTPERLLLATAGDRRDELDRALNSIYRRQLSVTLDGTIFYAPEFLARHFATKTWAVEADDEYERDELTAHTYFAKHIVMGTDATSTDPLSSYAPCESLPSFKDQAFIRWAEAMTQSLTLYSHYARGGPAYRRVHERPLPPLFNTVGDVKLRHMVYLTVVEVYAWLRAYPDYVQAITQLESVFDAYITALHAAPDDTGVILSLFKRVSHVVYFDGDTEAERRASLDAERRLKAVQETIATRYDAFSDADEFWRLFSPLWSGEALQQQQDQIDVSSESLWRETRKSYTWLLPWIEGASETVVSRRQEALLWLNMLMYEIVPSTRSQKDAVGRKEQPRVVETPLPPKKTKRSGEATQQQQLEERISKKKKTTKVRVTELEGRMRLLSVSGKTGLLSVKEQGCESSRLYVVEHGFSLQISVGATYNLIHC
jgi:hypothetical protein